MDLVHILGQFFPFIVYSVCGGIIVFLIVKRINDKKKENFEQRDN